MPKGYFEVELNREPIKREYVESIICLSVTLGIRQFCFSSTLLRTLACNETYGGYIGKTTETET